jgi:multidrug efflux pump subunit AcrB
VNSPEKEEAAARKAAREMKIAALTITLSFVFVLVLVALVVVIGHIRLF